jgi:hypothetical protein
VPYKADNTVATTNARLLKTKRFACKSPDSIPNDRLLGKSFRHNQCEPRIGKRVGQSIHDEPCAARRPPCLKHGPHVRRAKPLRPREAEASNQALLDAKARAPFAAARANYTAPTTGSHSHEKPVRSLATDYRGLECSLHQLIPDL